VFTHPARSDVRDSEPASGSQSLRSRIEHLVLSGERLMTPLEITQSTVASATGGFSM
jgi:hypothetical protein